MCFFDLNIFIVIANMAIYTLLIVSVYINFQDSSSILPLILYFHPYLADYKTLILLWVLFLVLLVHPPHLKPEG